MLDHQYTYNYVDDDTAKGSTEGDHTYEPSHHQQPWKVQGYLHQATSAFYIEVLLTVLFYHPLELRLIPGTG